MQSAPVVGGQEYQRLELRDQIRLRPETYIGAQAGLTDEQIWVSEIVGEGTIKTKYVSVKLALAVIGVTKEIFDNVTDNVERSRMEGIDPGHVEIAIGPNILSVKNHGKHIPVVIHHAERIWTPQLIFGVLLTSDNYNDSVSRYKIGRNGYGIKLVNIFSAAFMIEVADPVNKLLYKQNWTNGMSVCNPPVITPYEGPGYTQVSCLPDFNYFYHKQMEGNVSGEVFLDCMQGFFFSRALEISFAAKVPVIFNGQAIDFRDGLAYYNTHFDSFDPERNFIHWMSPDGKDEFIAVDTPNAGFAHAFVNGAAVHAGEHVNEYLKAICADVVADLEKKGAKEDSKKITVVNLRKHVSIILRVTLDKPEFDSQMKRKLIKPTPKIRHLPKEVTKTLLKWKMVDELKAFLGMKPKKEDGRVKPLRVTTVDDATQANSSNPHERLKCTLILTEGETGKTLALEGLNYLPGGKEYNGVFPLRGKLMNVSRHSEAKVSGNKELMSIMTILNAKKDIDYFKDRDKIYTLRYGKIALMADADYDGYHIDGLAIKFFFDYLKTLAPFEFVVIIMTPVIEGYRRNQRLAFYHQKQLAKWMRENDAQGWDFKYFKGLGSWTVNKQNCQKLFQSPVIVTMAVDPTTDDMLKLAFSKGFEDERKKWIAGYDPQSEIILQNPRPITDFFMEEFRDYSKASVIRAIPRLMDGLKAVHRKVLWGAILKFGRSKTIPKKLPKLTTFAGFVTERCQYHHGEGALHETIVGMGQCYRTGPNNIPVIHREGNYGTRRKRGADRSPPRYLFVALSPIARYIYRAEDDDILQITMEDGEPAEPKEFYPVIPMCLVNKCEGIATGWSTKIYPHDPRVVLEWVRRWVVEKKEKRHLSNDQLTIDLVSKPELIPWWREYTGSLVRVKNEPYESYRNEGRFDVNFHTINIRELPVEISPDAYKDWAEKMVDLYHEKPEEATFRDFVVVTPPPEIHCQIFGMSSPTVEKLNLVRTISMSNMTLLDKDEIPKKFNYTFEIMCEWCLDRLTHYTRRKQHLIRKSEMDAKLANLRYLYTMDVVEGRLDLRGRPKEEIHAYMKAHGYPYGKGKGKKKSVQNKGAVDETEEGKDERESQEELEKKDFLAMPQRSLTKELAAKIKADAERALADLEFYRNILEEDLWLRDLAELEVEINKLYSVPIDESE